MEPTLATTAIRFGIIFFTLSAGVGLLNLAVTAALWPVMRFTRLTLFGRLCSAFVYGCCVLAGFVGAYRMCLHFTPPEVPERIGDVTMFRMIIDSFVPDSGAPAWAFIVLAVLIVTNDASRISRSASLAEAVLIKDPTDVDAPARFNSHAWGMLTASLIACLMAWIVLTEQMHDTRILVAESLNDSFEKTTSQSLKRPVRYK